MYNSRVVQSLVAEIERMKIIEVDDQLYHYIASQTLHIGESASDILRRLLAVAEPSLHGDTHQSPAAPVISAEIKHTMPDVLTTVLKSTALTQEESAVGRFLLILSALYRTNADAFRQATAIKGRKRVYFSEDFNALIATGPATKPKQIPDSPFWVITNTNTGRKRLILDQLMQSMGYSADFSAEVSQKV